IINLIHTVDFCH
ncbi:hypothetical protein EC80586_2999, partial [Escherichia coli 8.0586]